MTRCYSAQRGTEWRRHVRRSVRPFWFAAALVFVGAFPAQAEIHPSVEYQVKASYLYNFLQFVEWPSDAFASGSITVCVFGEDRFGSALAATAGESSRGRKIEIRRVSALQELQPCHVAFISSSERRREFQVLRELAGRPVLTIGETRGFTDRGGIINLVPVGKTIRFEINQPAAQRNRLKVSAQLMQLAVRR